MYIYIHIYINIYIYIYEHLSVQAACLSCDEGCGEAEVRKCHLRDVACIHSQMSEIHISPPLHKEAASLKGA